MKILLIDDEIDFSRALQQLMREQNFQVDVAPDGIVGLEMASCGQYELLIVDVMMPGMTGFEVVQTLRNDESTIPILLLTAKDSVQDRVTGLDSGADDYLIKPFATAELLSRIHALTRRGRQVHGLNHLQVGSLRLNLMTSTLTCGEREIRLTNKEFQLLDLFMRNPKRVLSKELIFDRVWGPETLLDSNVVETYIHFLRKKMASLSTECNVAMPVLETVRGVGYVFA